MRGFLSLFLAGAALAGEVKTPSGIEAVRRFEAPAAQHQSVVAYDGKLCVLGGAVPPDIKGLDRFVCRGAQGSWEPLARMPAIRQSAGAAVLGGRLYVFGGGEDWPRTYPEGISYGPDGWRSEGQLPTPRQGAAAVVWNDRLYVLGGGADDAARPAEERSWRLHKEVFWRAAGGRWTRAADMPTPRGTPVVGVIGDRIFVAGGIGSGTRMTGALEAYDPRKDSWEILPAMPIPRTDPSGGAIAGRLYVAGGNASGSCTAALQIYDVAAQRWSQGPAMTRARCNASAAALGGKLYVLGGSDTAGRLHDMMEVFDPGRNEWTTEGLGPVPRAVAPAPPQYSEVDPSGPRRRDGEKDLAIVVGVDRYRALPAADFAERDAASFASALTGPLGLPEENVIRLIGSRATRTDIAKYIEEWLPRNAEPESRVYFYFSGHGAPEVKTGAAHLVPWDGDPTFLQSSAYPLERLYANLAKLPAREVIVVLDSCFSGAGGRSVLAAGTRPLVTRVSLPKPKGRLSILTASAGDEITGSLAGGGHGLFTYHLLQGLGGGADKDADGHVKLSELHGFVKGKVQRAARRQNREQTPQLIAPDPAMPVY